MVHMLFASIWGYWIARAHLARRPVFLAGLGGFAIAAGLHGVYDFMVLLKPYSALPCAALLVTVIWLWRLKVMRELHNEARQASATHNKH